MYINHSFTHNETTIENEKLLYFIDRKVFLKKKEV